MMFTDEMLAEARSAEAKRVAAIRARLDAGEEITFDDAISLYGVRRSEELWQFGELSARGRIGGPTRTYSEIPAAAWLHLRHELVNFDFLAVEPDGTRIYDIQVRASTVAADILEPPPISVATSSNPADVFDHIVEAQRAGGAAFGLDDYSRMLETVGLKLGEKGRVPGTKLGKQGRVEIVHQSSGIDLHKALMFTQYRKEWQRYAAFPTKQAVAADLHRWLAENHVNVPGANFLRHPNPRKLKSFCEDLGRSFES